MSLLRALVAQPSLVLRHRNIFLLSHMRANTSLFGHLVGSHPEIEGYYEMHIGYYSERSLWRQKLLHFRQHAAKPRARFMFDKILHDGHHVAEPILARASTRVIFMIREPEQSIRSLVALYQSRSPHRPEATVEGATDYYTSRLQTLGRIAQALGPRYFYLDAEALVARTPEALGALSEWLGLAEPIPTEYQTFAMTGRPNSGDPSTRLTSGRVQPGGGRYEHIDLPDALRRQARDAYLHCRRLLVTGSARHVSTDDPVRTDEPTPATPLA